MADVPAGKTVLPSRATVNGEHTVGVDLEVVDWENMRQGNSVVMVLTMEISHDGGQTWETAARFEYLGGGIDKTSGLPSKGPSPRYTRYDDKDNPIAFPQGTLVRNVIEVSKPMVVTAKPRP